MPARRRWISTVALARTAFVASIFILLEVLCRLGVIDRVTMIPPSEMVSALFDILRSGRFNADIAFTCTNTLWATGLAISVGFFLGAGLHALPRRAFAACSIRCCRLITRCRPLFFIRC